jgi:CBS-domain-containing membrane protein
MLFYLEYENPPAQPSPADGKALSELLKKLGCSSRLLLAKPLPVALGGDSDWAGNPVHPPAGANPVIMVYAQAHWSALLNPVLLGVCCLVLVAVVWSRLYPGLVHYPVSPLEPSPPSLNWGGWPDQG